MHECLSAEKLPGHHPRSTQQGWRRGRAICKSCLKNPTKQQPLHHKNKPEHIFYLSVQFILTHARTQVFELLSNLALPCFCADNWQSTIRHYAAGHPKYRDILRAFTGRETSDIVYDDTSGALTALLIARSHLQAPQWAGVTPRYYIEVKSTTDGCDVPFFVSQGQAERVSYFQLLNPLGTYTTNVASRWARPLCLSFFPWASLLTRLTPCKTRCVAPQTAPPAARTSKQSTPSSGSSTWARRRQG